MTIIALLALSLLPTRAAAADAPPFNPQCINIDIALKQEHPEHGFFKLSRPKLLEKRLANKCPGTPPSPPAKPAPPKPKTEAELKAEAAQHEAARVKKCAELAALLSTKQSALKRMTDTTAWNRNKCAGPVPKP